MPENTVNVSTAYSYLLRMIKSSTTNADNSHTACSNMHAPAHKQQHHVLKKKNKKLCNEITIELLLLIWYKA